MNHSLLENGYVVVRGFIPEYRAAMIAREFKASKNDGFTDDQVPSCMSLYNCLPVLELMCEKTKEIGDIIGEFVLPTYCYGRHYTNGADLKEHVDREACEVSASVNLYSDKTWPLFVRSKNGNEVGVELGRGDALIYLGCDIPHWRKPFEGTDCVQVFIHYVRSRGINNWAYFDRQYWLGNKNDNR